MLNMCQRYTEGGQNNIHMPGVHREGQNTRQMSVYTDRCRPLTYVRGTQIGAEY